MALTNGIQYLSVFLFMTFVAVIRAAVDGLREQTEELMVGDDCVLSEFYNERAKEQAGGRV
jgi:hypothetical protein